MMLAQALVLHTVGRGEVDEICVCSCSMARARARAVSSVPSFLPLSTARRLAGDTGLCERAV
jgi:hypothetical protein